MKLDLGPKQPTLIVDVAWRTALAPCGTCRHRCASSTCRADAAWERTLGHRICGRYLQKTAKEAAKEPKHGIVCICLYSAHKKASTTVQVVFVCRS